MFIRWCYRQYLPHGEPRFSEQIDEREGVWAELA